jgi:dynein heavy chain, axonemal
MPFVLSTDNVRLITVLSAVPRLRLLVELEVKREQLEADRESGRLKAEYEKASQLIEVQKNDSSVTTIYKNIAGDDDVLRIMVLIMSGMSSSVDKLQKYLSFWEKYKHVWDYDKDAYIRRYARSNRTLAAFESDTQKYKDLQKEVQQEDSVTNMNFISIDCTLLKASIVSHCVSWQKKFTTLLNEQALAELSSLHDFFSSSLARLDMAPPNLEGLGSSITLLRQLQSSTASVEARFEPLNLQYKLLEKFEVTIKEEELSRLSLLPAAWQNFTTTLVEAERKLNDAKKNMKKDLERAVVQFDKEVATLREDFQNNAPMNASNFSFERALQIISEFRERCNSNANQEKILAQGMEIFELDKPDYKDLAAVSSQLELLDQVWQMTREWDNMWNDWKAGEFRTLRVETMDDAAQKFSRRVTKLGKEIKSWLVWQSLKETVEKFKTMMPLIQDLRSPALRERHWSQLMEEVGKTFDYNSADFNLERIFSLGLDQHAELVANISGSAGKELMIEQALISIKATFSCILVCSDASDGKTCGWTSYRTRTAVIASSAARRTSSLRWMTTLSPFPR